jgi:hypothetical protein
LPALPPFSDKLFTVFTTIIFFLLLENQRMGTHPCYAKHYNTVSYGSHNERYKWKDEPGVHQGGG